MEGIITHATLITYLPIAYKCIAIDQIGTHLIIALTDIIGGNIKISLRSEGHLKDIPLNNSMNRILEFGMYVGLTAQALFVFAVARYFVLICL